MASAGTGWPGAQGDRGPDARLRPGDAGSPGSQTGDPQGRPHFAHPGRAAREPRSQRLSVLCARIEDLELGKLRAPGALAETDDAVIQKD